VKYGCRGGLAAAGGEVEGREESVAALKIELFGGFAGRLGNGEALTLKGRKTQALLACLALEPGVAHSRERLTGLLWGGRGEEQARGSLR